MKLSVIIPFQNTDYIEKNFASLSNQDISADQYELIYVDDCSAENYQEMFDGFQRDAAISVIYARTDSPRGCFHARNVGIALANGDLVAFIDIDMTADREWLKNLSQPFKTSSKVGGVVGLVCPESPSVMVEALVYAPSGQMIYNGFGTGNVAYRKEILDDVGGFDERFDPKFRGDTDLGCEVIKKEFEIVYEPKAIAYHPIKKIRLSELFKYSAQHVHDVLLYKKHKALLKSNDELCSVLGSLFSSPFLGPMSLSGLAFVIIVPIEIFLLMKSGVLFFLGSAMTIFFVWTLLFILHGYRYAALIPEDMRLPFSLRIRGALHLFIYFLLLPLVRIWGSIKYREFFV